MKFEIIGNIVGFSDPDEWVLIRAESILEDDSVMTEVPFPLIHKLKATKEQIDLCVKARYLKRMIIAKAIKDLSHVGQSIQSLREWDIPSPKVSNIIVTNIE